MLCFSGRVRRIASPPAHPASACSSQRVARSARIMACALAKSPGTGSAASIIAGGDHIRSSMPKIWVILPSSGTTFFRHPPVDAFKQMVQLSGVITNVPSAVEGQMNRRRSRFFVKRQAPRPSCQITLIRPPCRPQKQNR